MVKKITEKALRSNALSTERYSINISRQKHARSQQNNIIILALSSFLAAEYKREIEIQRNTHFREEIILTRISFAVFISYFGY